MVGSHPLGTQGLIRDDDFELIAIFVGDEQIQLYRTFLLLLGARADE